MHTTESNFSIFVIEYLGESKLNSKILWPVYQGPRWVRIMKKTGGKKSRDTLPLNEILSQSEEETSMYMYYVMYSDQPSEQKN